jgi:16S rRNA (guanine527-N7)-methyltransferase
MAFLEEGLDRLGVHYETAQLELISLHLKEIERWNRRHNLVKARGRQLVVRHVLDSLAGLDPIRAVKQRATIVDVGSGAGFPGIPLSIFLTDSLFFLLDRSAIRAAFLKNIVTLLGLKHVAVIEDDLGNVDRCFDVVTFRAFSPLQACWRGIARITRPGGTVAAYKGRPERFAREIESIKADSVTVLPLQVPGLDAARNLVIIKFPQEGLKA